MINHGYYLYTIIVLFFYYYNYAERSILLQKQTFELNEELKKTENELNEAAKGENKREIVITDLLQQLKFVDKEV